MGIELLFLDDLLVCVDFILVYLLKILEMVGLIDKEVLVKIKLGVIIVNVVCGGLVDEVVLVDVIIGGYVWVVGLDVFVIELCIDSLLFELV